MTRVPGRRAAIELLWSPRALTVIRIISEPDMADSEYGWDCHARCLVRNRQRKNCPGTAPSRSRLRPVMYTDTMPGASGRTLTTVKRCLAAMSSGVRTRYHRIRAPTVAYMADQTQRAVKLSVNEGPLANWWLNASAIARAVWRWA